MTETFNEVAPNAALRTPDFQVANLWSERNSGRTASPSPDCLPCCDFIDSGAGNQANTAGRVGPAVEADRARCDTPQFTPRPQDPGGTQGLEATPKFPIFRPTSGGSDIPPITPIMPPPTGREWGLPVEVGPKTLKEAEGSAKHSGSASGTAERNNYPPTRHPWSTR